MPYPQGGGGRHNRPPQQNQIPKPNTVKYYLEPKKLDPRLLDEDAEDWAKRLSKVSTSQLRRFYEDVLVLKRRIQIETDEAGAAGAEKVFDRLRAEFKMLKAKATYAHGRDGRQFPQEFLQFFVNHVHSVNGLADFEAFCKHFEAVVAFHKLFGKKN